MSHENLEVARQVLEALRERDPARLVSLAEPDVEWHSFFALKEGRAYLGYDGAHQYMRDLSEAWEVARAEVDQALGFGDVVVLVGQIRYRGKGSGVESTSPAGWMLKFRRGKVVCFRAFRDPERALEAVGLRD
jgi:ketosteroid isomerase-like protein